MKIINIPVDDLIPYEKNAKIHPQKQVHQIAESLKRFGWQQPIVIDKDKVVIIGHGRLLAAKELGLHDVPVTMADDLTPELVNALRLADNKTNESEWDFSILEEELAALKTAGIDMEQFGFDLSLDQDNSDTADKPNIYTDKTNPVQYMPVGEDTETAECLDCTKRDELVKEIQLAEDIKEDEKKFLIEAANRHLVFDYRKIAEYYAKASPTMQRLMEKSALVIIDIDDAIAYGYAVLGKEIERIRNESKKA